MNQRSLWIIGVCESEVFVNHRCLWSRGVCEAEMFVRHSCLWDRAVCEAELFVALICLWCWSVCEAELFVKLTCLSNWAAYRTELFVERLTECMHISTHVLLKSRGLYLFSNTCFNLNNITIKETSSGASQGASRAYFPIRRVVTGGLPVIDWIKHANLAQAPAS